MKNPDPTAIVTLFLVRRTPFASGTARVNQRHPSRIDSQTVPNEENICVSLRLSSRCCLLSSTRQTKCMRSLPRPYDSNVTAKPRANLAREANRPKLTSQSKNTHLRRYFTFPQSQTPTQRARFLMKQIIVQLKALSPQTLC